MSFSYDILHALHQSERRTSEDGTEDYGFRCHATTIAAQESYGVHTAKQEQLLYQHTEHYSRRGRPY